MFRRGTPLRTSLPSDFSLDTSLSAVLFEVPNASARPPTVPFGLFRK